MQYKGQQKAKMLTLVGLEPTTFEMASPGSLEVQCSYPLRHRAPLKDLFWLV